MCTNEPHNQRLKGNTLTAEVGGLEIEDLRQICPDKSHIKQILKLAL